MARFSPRAPGQGQPGRLSTTRGAPVARSGQRSCSNVLLKGTLMGEVVATRAGQDWWRRFLEQERYPAAPGERPHTPPGLLVHHS